MKLIVYLFLFVELFVGFCTHAAQMDSKKPFANKENKQQGTILVSTKKRIGNSKSDKENFHYRKFVLHRNLRRNLSQRIDDLGMTIPKSRFHVMIDEAMTKESPDGKKRKDLFHHIEHNNAQFRSANILKPFVSYVVEHYGNNIWAPTVISKLLAGGANPNSINPETGLAALHVAIYQQHKELVEQLVIGKANVDMPTRDGQTPLHFACATGNLEIVKYLVAHGADVDARDKNDAAPMHFVVGRSLSKSMPSFLQFPNKRVGRLVNNKYRPQIEARKKIIDFLLENKAEFEPKDSDNETPYHICCRELHFSLASFLERKKPVTLPQNATGNDDATPSHD